MPCSALPGPAADATPCKLIPAVVDLAPLWRPAYSCPALPGPLVANPCSSTLKPSSRACPRLVRGPGVACHARQHAPILLCAFCRRLVAPAALCPVACLLLCYKLALRHAVPKNSRRLAQPTHFLRGPATPPAVTDEMVAHLKEMGLPSAAKGNGGQGT